MTEEPTGSGRRTEAALIAFLNIGMLLGMGPFAVQYGKALGARWLQILAALTFLPGTVLLLRSLVLALGAILRPSKADTARSAWFGLVVGSAIFGVALLIWIPVVAAGLSR